MHLGHPRADGDVLWAFLFAFSTGDAGLRTFLDFFFGVPPAAGLDFTEDMSVVVECEVVRDGDTLWAWHAVATVGARDGRQVFEGFLRVGNDSAPGISKHADHSLFAANSVVRVLVRGRGRGGVGAGA